MEAILRVPRISATCIDHCIARARDMAYPPVVGVRTVFSLLLAPLLSASTFKVKAHGDGFGYLAWVSS